MDIAVVFNDRAGSAADVDPAKLVERIASVTGREVEILRIEDHREPSVCVREALAAGARMIVAAGGDGTVSACAAELIDKPVELGVLPVGTSNSFAAALGVPDDLRGAVAQLGEPSRRFIDAAVVENATTRKVMVLHCMVGLHAEAIEETSSEAKRRWGALAYAGTALKKLAALESFTVELATASHVVKCSAVAIAVANLAPLRTVLAHGPSHVLGDDGHVDVTIVAASSMAEMIATGVHLYRAGRDHEAATRDNIGSFSTAHVRITADPPQRVLVDGEAFGETPVRVTTLPRALTVVAPPAEPAEGAPVEAPLVGLPELEIAVRQ